MNEGLVYSMFANEESPHLIETTTTFYQDAMGEDIQASINSGFLNGNSFSSFDSPKYSFGDFRHSLFSNI